MESIKIGVTICSLIISSIISLITIYVNIRLTKLSINESRKLKQYDQHKVALIKYYLPIKFCLIKLERLICENNNTYFDMFSRYSYDVRKESKREEIIKEYLNFINKFNSLTLFFTNNQIDSQISKVYEHISIVLLDDRKVLDISEYREKYRMPNLKDIIELIDEYSKEYEKYEEKKLWKRFKDFIMQNNK